MKLIITFAGFTVIVSIGYDEKYRSVRAGAVMVRVFKYNTLIKIRVT